MQSHKRLTLETLQNKPEKKSIPGLKAKLRTKTKPVQMMFLKDTFPICYLETMKVKIAELPYVNNDLSMLILLPDDIEDKSTGLEQLERELTYEKLSKWTSAEMMKTTEVELFLPRIKLEESYNLKSTLSSMGMKDAFILDKADFTGMSEHKDLFLLQVFHKSFVEVNEEGTEAAASGAVVVVVRASVNAICCSSTTSYGVDVALMSVSEEPSHAHKESETLRVRRMVMRDHCNP
ncbi:Heterochromatin-associated protein MENT [Chelonia mydas]|uniref:Heterochromatin-associated protein MENT n=1 Tax=Chelonia mydas TaxID=8469 RepID=M7BX47_CHEMY|nr:Heterochromatin-associated protein MENT [Chelonia mydas]